MPALSRGAPAPSAPLIARWTGTRCTTLTQLPVAFWGGSRANSAPVAGLMLMTVARQVRSG
ncbi:MAG: hypothetical protein V3S87_06410 [Alphaproteobacteria bacterium]